MNIYRLCYPLRYGGDNTVLVSSRRMVIMKVAKARAIEKERLMRSRDDKRVDEIWVYDDRTGKIKKRGEVIFKKGKVSF